DEGITANTEIVDTIEPVEVTPTEAPVVEAEPTEAPVVESEPETVEEPVAEPEDTTAAQPNSVG
ncbi:MAG: flagella E, partial [Clostridia bacterium]|nr:flagella E [Clostridia bacterium]